MSDSPFVPALKVRQWLAQWENVPFDDHSFRRKPEPWFYVFSLSAVRLRALSGIRRRTTEGRLARSQDLGIQRRHDRDRSEVIAQFVRYGFPCSEVPPARRASGEYDDLLKPGWLPTAIVVNIIGPGEKRGESSVAETDVVSVSGADDGLATIRLPQELDTPGWTPRGLPPIEVIDGQHRLWAFEDSLEANYELPVVAFYNLDISWQAYLFWTINIRPKKINASLAFDLYPLLRTEDWLERFEGHSVYRETRAQELTEVLWAYPESPWYQRINMLGETGNPWPRQAAWIRSLLATFVKSSEGRRVQIGGLFGAPVGEDRLMLPWSRLQQAAFLIFVWQAFADALSKTDLPWTEALRHSAPNSPYDPALAAKESLLNTDQGIRGFLFVSNDLCFRAHRRLHLREWDFEGQSDVLEPEEVAAAIDSLRQLQPLRDFVQEMTRRLTEYDWRSSSAPGLSAEERLAKAALRGAGGYKILRTQLLQFLADGEGEIATTAEQVLAIRGEGRD